MSVVMVVLGAHVFTSMDQCYPLLVLLEGIAVSLEPEAFVLPMCPAVLS
jgi:hypothetical protein